MSQSHGSKWPTAISASSFAAQQSFSFSSSSEVRTAAVPLPSGPLTTKPLRGLRSITTPPSCGPLVCGVMNWWGWPKKPRAGLSLLPIRGRHRHHPALQRPSSSWDTWLIHWVMWLKCEAKGVKLPQFISLVISMTRITPSWEIIRFKACFRITCGKSKAVFWGFMY